MAEPRIVAGLSCMDVLASLSELVDGELSATHRQQILDHLAGCNWCEEFGGRFSSLVSALRSEASAGDLDDGVAERLQQFLSDRLET
jgi:anti-sigma factor RsiW